MDMSKQKYIASNIWMDNVYLVNPLTAVKKCQCCNKFKYSSEYIDCYDFTDSKLPVCIPCMRSKENASKCASILDKHGKTRTCKGCEEVCNLFDMSMNWAINKVGSKCQKCVSRALKKAFSR